MAKPGNDSGAGFHHKGLLVSFVMKPRDHNTGVCRLICAAIGAPTRLRIKEKSGHYNEPRNL